MNDYEKFEQTRKQVQAISQREGSIKHISFEVFKRTDEERGKLFTEKAEYKRKINDLH